MSNREFGDGYGTIKDYELSPTGSAYEGEEGTARGYQTDDYVQFQSLSDTISGNIFQINSNVQALERISKQLGNQLKEMPYDKLHRIQQGTNRLATETTICYKRLLNLSGRSDSEKRHQKLQQQRLKDEFEDSISRYRNVQKKLAEKSRHVMNSTAVTFTSHRDDSRPHDDDDTSDKTKLLSEERDRQLQKQAEDTVSFDQSHLEERERMMRQLESDVLDVNEIFRDLATMVHDQGEVVDSIEGHVIKGHDNVVNANEQLRKASVYQKRARKKKCCLLVIFLLVLGVIGLVIYLKLK